MAKASPLKSGNYLKSPTLFFDSSKLLFSQITNIFDFALPVIAGMWNLRWQVNGYIQAHPNSSNSELYEKFAKDSGGDRANLKRACQDFTWDEQTEQFATFLLVNSFAFYESWIKNILTCIGGHTVKMEKALQYSTRETETTPTKGIKFAISNLTKPHSNVMRELFYPSYLANPKNSIDILDDLMLCYRYFKELRNCIMHNGGIADAKLMEAYEGYIALTPEKLGAIEVPAINIPVSNKLTSAKLRGVIGFYDIILKLVATIDAELSVSKKAEKLIINKSKKTNGRPFISPNADKKKRAINSIFKNIYMPKPLDLLKAEDFLKRNSLVY